MLQAVGDPVRYRILQCLLQSPATQKQLAEELNLSSGALSKQMAKLAAAHLVLRQRSHGPYQLQFRDGVWKLLQSFVNLKGEIVTALLDAAEQEAEDLSRAGMRTADTSVRSKGA